MLPISSSIAAVTALYSAVCENFSLARAEAATSLSSATLIQLHSPILFASFAKRIREPAKPVHLYALFQLKNAHTSSNRHPCPMFLQEP